MESIDDEALVALDIDALVSARERVRTEEHQPAWEAAALKALSTYWGHPHLRDDQRAAVGAAVAGRDVLVVLATGAGKSVCYQLVPLITGKPAVVVSPLIALMADQVAGLHARGVKAVLLGTAQTDAGAEARALAGEYDLVYITPEKLVAGFDLSRLQRARGVSLLAVDEAHCVAEWGFDFRPSYAALGAHRLAGVPLMALTATAPPAVRAEVRSSLRLSRDAAVVLGSLRRPNLRYEARRKGAEAALDLMPLLREESGATIIYVATIREAEALGDSLRSRGVGVGVFTGSAALAAKADVLRRFVRDELRVVVATIAFGMGIDKQDVRLVLHYGPPSSPEA